MDRLEELADFLKTRRARIHPDEVGLPLGQRRRTPGLRREEVAELAGISTTWYTWMEQARPVKMSATTLERIARALTLNHDEMVYLFDLAQLPPPEQDEPREDMALSRMKSMIGTMIENPSYIIGPRWDLLGWNELADKVFSLSRLEDKRPNLIRIIFMENYFRKLWVNWERDARELLAQLRVDYNQNAADKAAYEALVEELSAGSEEFRKWWPHHEVKLKTSWLKEINHPKIGLLSLESIVLATPARAYPRLIIYSAASSQDREKLQKLAGGLR